MVRHRSLQLAAAIPDEWSRIRALVHLRARQVHFGGGDRSQQFVKLLETLGAETRRTFTANIADLVPVVTALAGVDTPAEFAEIATAIIDVGRWWP